MLDLIYISRLDFFARQILRREEFTCRSRLEHQLLSSGSRRKDEKEPITVEAAEPDPSKPVSSLANSKSLLISTS